jgi:hypothetical protein
MLFRNPLKPDAQEPRTLPTPMSYTLLTTGALGRMRNISATQMVLHGVVTADRIELEGQEYIVAQPISTASAAAIAKATAATTPADAAASSDAPAPSDSAAPSEDSSSAAAAPAVAVAPSTETTAVAAQPTAQQQADEMAAESIRISQAGGRLLRRERMSLTRRRLPAAASSSVSEAAQRAAQNVWTGSYLITHETVGGNAAPEDLLTQKMMNMLNAAEKEANDEKNEEVMESLVNLIEEASKTAHQPRIVLSIPHEIEIEFTPSCNFDERPNTYVNLFQSDLIRFAELVDGLEQAEAAIALARTAKAFTLSTLGAAAATGATASPTAAAATAAQTAAPIVAGSAEVSPIEAEAVVAPVTVAVAAVSEPPAAAATVVAAAVPAAAAPAASSETNAVAEVASVAPAAEQSAAVPGERTNVEAAAASAPSS